MPEQTLPERERRRPQIDLVKLNEELGHPMPGNALANAPAQFAPLIERAPELTGEAVRQAHEVAAARIEAATTMLQEELNSCIVLGRDLAQSIRSFGESQAQSIEQATGMVRDMARIFRSQSEKLQAFKAGVAP